MRLIVVLFAWILTAQTCLAWSEGGHHLITLVAYDLLKPERQERLRELIKFHPRFAEDFVPPEKLPTEREKERWTIGRAGYWPDVARKTTFDRPNWHWQLGPNLVIGDVATVPANPGPCPLDATLGSKDLHIAQAVELCRRIWRDKSQPSADRAIALCWLAHLVGDAHQPCHAGSLYSAVAFRDGDRGANSIPTKQRKNLHSLWDGLLGPDFSVGGVRRRRLEILENRDLCGDAKLAANAEGGLEPLTWLSESSEMAKEYVYTQEVLDHIDAVERKVVSKLEPIDLSEEYLKAAGTLAQKRAAYASYRLARFLIEGLE